jgi:hypothetical protein
MTDPGRATDHGEGDRCHRQRGRHGEHDGQQGRQPAARQRGTEEGHLKAPHRRRGRHQETLHTISSIVVAVRAARRPDPSNRG